MRNRWMAYSIAFVLTTTAGAGLAARAQSETAPEDRVMGYQDARTGRFHRLMGAMPEAAATAPFTGTIQLVVAITLKTPVPSGGSVLCSSNVLAESENTSSFAISSYDENASIKAVVSGTTASCTVNIPYSWSLPPASSTVKNLVMGSYVVEIVGATGTGTPVPLTRYSSSQFVSLTAVPPVGTISKFTIAATL